MKLKICEYCGKNFEGEPTMAYCSRVCMCNACGFEIETKKCDQDFEAAPKIEFENPNEQVAEGMILQEKGKYLCTKCNSMIGEYRTFLKN